MALRVLAPGSLSLRGVAFRGAFRMDRFAPMV